jgi:hypothetical protein
MSWRDLIFGGFLVACFTLGSVLMVIHLKKPDKATVNIDKHAKKKPWKEGTAQDAVLPALKDAGVTTDNLYMNNNRQFIVCVPRDDITEWLDKNRNAKIESLTPLNSAGGQTEKIIVIYQLNK